MNNIDLSKINKKFKEECSKRDCESCPLSNYNTTNCALVYGFIIGYNGGLHDKLYELGKDYIDE